ncbi:unnamed protein product [Phyllotreta striolata]|uniref:Gustatory receptor n=1 Tax=Phyllotreta striolata TaxID=444603 RepID=A0A9N9TR52_PHYSR|nr:unnamed protein product [Phyllotreta striolata]
MLRKIEFSISIGNIFGVAPLIDFNSTTIRKRRLYRSYAVSYYLIIQLIQIYSIYQLLAPGSSHNIYAFSLFAEVLRDILDSLNCFITFIGSSFWNARKWIELHRKSKRIQQSMRPKPNSFVRNYKKLLTINLITCTLVSLVANMFWCIRDGYIVQSKYFIKYVCMSIQQVQLSIAFSYIYYAYLQYKELNSTFVRQFRMKCLLSGSVDKMFRQLRELIADINSLFGIQIFLTIISNSILTLHGMEVVTAPSWKHSTDALANIMVVFSFIILPILVIFAADWTAAESQKLIALCYEFQENYPVFSREKQELLNLVEHVRATKPALTAGHFFDLNYKTLFTLSGTIITYFFVLMQFNSTFGY